MTDAQDDPEFDEALERSSLGSAGARDLRKQTPSEEVDRVRELASLRNAIVFGRGSADTFTELISLYLKLDYEADLIAVWRLACANLARFRYMPQVLEGLSIQRAARLLDVTEASAGALLLARIDFGRGCSIIRSMQRSSAGALLNKLPPDPAAKIIAELIAKNYTSESVIWLKAVQPSVGARALCGHVGAVRFSSLGGRLLDELTVGKALEFLRAVPSIEDRVRLVSAMSRSSKVTRILPYREALDMLTVVRSDPMRQLLYRRVVAALREMDADVAQAELTRIGSRDPVLRASLEHG